MNRWFWPGNAIALGAWETLAVTTRRAPTISAVVWQTRKHHPRLVPLAIGVWTIALADHLLRGH
jgi:hypothetical protein